MEEFNLSDKFEEAFTDAKKVSFLKNTREVEVFKLALQIAFGFNKEFIKRLKKKLKPKGVKYVVGWKFAQNTIDKLVGRRFTDA